MIWKWKNIIIDNNGVPQMLVDQEDNLIS